MRVQTVEELAEALGIHKSTIYRWRTDGWGIDDLFDNGWDVEEVRAWSKEMKKARRSVLRPGFDVTDDDGIDGDERKWSIVYKKSKAIMATLSAKKMQHELVDRAEVEETNALKVAELTTALDSLAAQLAPRLVPLTRESEIQGVLRDAFNQLRDHFARD